MKIIKKILDSTEKYSLLLAFVVVVIIVGAEVYKNSNREEMITGYEDKQIDDSNVLGVKTLTTPSPKTKPTTTTTKPVQKVVNSDPIVSCQFPHTGTIAMPESKCDKMTDCEVSPGKWQAVWKKDCEALDKNQKTTDTTTSTAKSVSTTRKKVPIDFNYDRLTGTYYCYEDRINEISRLRDKLSMEGKRYDICFSVKTSFNNCTDMCPSLFEDGYENYQPCLDKCIDEHIESCDMDSLNKVANDLLSLVDEICP
jgi:hypothetical protein